MAKYNYIVLLFFVASTANAGYFEVEAGQSNFTKIGDGVWYQEPFPHSLDLKSNAFSFTYGIPSTWGDTRFSIFDLGNVETHSMVVPEDSNYDFDNHVCKDPCLPLSRFTGKGSARGISATIQPTYHTGMFKIYLEGGYAYTNVKWSVYIKHDPAYTYPTYPLANMDGQMEGDCSVCKVDHWIVTKRYGGGIGYGKWSLNYSYFPGIDATGKNANAVPIFKSAHTITLRYEF